MTTKAERIRAACIAGDKAAKAGLPEEPPKGLDTLEIASWRMGWAGVVAMESPEPEPEPTVEEERQYEDFDIGDGFGPVRVPVLTEEEKRRCEEMAAARFQRRVEYELRQLFKRFRSEHTRQPGEGAWFVFTNPEPRHAEILRAFVDRNREELEVMAAERDKVYSTRAHYARAALGRMQKSQFTRPVDRTHAVSKEWLVEAGWTPTKDVTKKGNAHRPYWRRSDGVRGRVTVFAAQGGGWQIQLFIDGAPHYPWQTFSTAAAAYSTAHMHLNLEEPRPALPAPELEEWIAI